MIAETITGMNRIEQLCADISERHKRTLEMVDDSDKILHGLISTNQQIRDRLQANQSMLYNDTEVLSESL